MPTAFTCPQCHASQVLPAEAAGRTVRCPACQAEFPAAPQPAKRRVLPWVIGLVLLVGAGVAVYLVFNRSTPTEYTDPQEMFSARFPNPPEAKAVSEAQPQRLLWGEKLYRAWAGGKEYAVAVIDGVNAGDEGYGPASRDAHINGVIVLTEVNTDGQQLLDRKATHEGHPAREVVFVRKDDGKLTALRVLAGEHQVLRLAVTGGGDRNNPSDFLDRAGEFFDGVHVGPAFGPPVVSDPPTVTADELAAAYKADARAADAKYKDQWLRVTGSVREVNKDKGEFQMKAGDGVVLVRRPPLARRTVQVRAGQEVSLTGKCRGLDANGEGPHVVLEDAIVANPPPPK